MSRSIRHAEGTAPDAAAPATYGAYRQVMVLVGAMATADGRWRVEAHRERRQDWYRVLRDGAVYEYGGHLCERVVLGTVQAVLAEAGVDLAELVPVD